jgi:hypothetical protein
MRLAGRDYGHFAADSGEYLDGRSYPAYDLAGSTPNVTATTELTGFAKKLNGSGRNTIIMQWTNLSLGEMEDQP